MLIEATTLKLIGIVELCVSCLPSCRRQTQVSNPFIDMFYFHHYFTTI